MSIRSAIILCRDKVSESLATTSQKDKTACSKEAEFALSVLAEAMEDDFVDRCPLCSCAEDGLGVEFEDDLPADLDGVSVDENPEDETREEKRERERSRGFFG